MRFPLAALTLLATLLSPAAARAYCRTTTQPLPANYSPKYGCFTGGLFLYWKNACISYSINSAASVKVPYEDAKRIIDESFATWVNARCDTGTTPGISVSNIGPADCAEVRYNANGPNQNLILFRDDGWPYNDPGSTLGLTTVTFNADTGEIYDADMEINSSTRYLSITDPVSKNGFDLASVITHEAGHFLGLAHATDPSATMFASYKPESTALRTLAPDDVAGICAIYPDASIRTVSSAISVDETVSADTCDPTPRHGFAPVCASPKRSKDDCEAAPRPTMSWSVSGCAAMCLTGIVFVRRRRRSC